DVEAEDRTSYARAGARSWSAVRQCRGHRRRHFRVGNAVCPVAKSGELPKRKFASARTRDGQRKRASPEGAWPGGNKAAAKIGRIAGVGSEVRRIARRCDHSVAGGTTSVFTWYEGL